MVRLIERLREEEDGFAMIVAVILLMVVGALSAMILLTSTHSNFSTSRDRNSVESLHVAEAGVQAAIQGLQITNGMAASPLNGTTTANGTTTEGSYSVTTTKKSRNTYQIVSRGTVGTGAGLVAARRVQVTMAPPSSFKYALFSLTSVDTKNNDLITGDVWANTNVTVDDNDVVDGSVVAATGWVALNSNSRVTKDAWSGGFNTLDSNMAIHLNNGASIGGLAKASVTGSCASADSSKYEVRLDTNSSAQDVTTFGTRTGPGSVPGTVNDHTCTTAPATRTMPTFTYNSANYDPSTLHEFGTPTTFSSTAASDFQNYLDATKSNFRGTYTVFQSGALSQSNRLDLTGVTVTGDTTIVTNLPIFTNGVSDSSTGDRLVILVSYYQPPAGTQCDVNHDDSECSVHLKNNFQPSCATAVLVYTPAGPSAVKNNQSTCGSVYAQNIQIKNNQTLTYDSRVDRVVGFGDSTLTVQKWVELAS